MNSEQSEYRMLTISKVGQVLPKEVRFGTIFSHSNCHRNHSAATIQDLTLKKWSTWDPRLMDGLLGDSIIINIFSTQEHLETTSLFFIILLLIIWEFHIIHSITLTPSPPRSMPPKKSTSPTKRRKIPICIAYILIGAWLDSQWPAH